MTRPRLSRERIVAAAAEVADREGLAGVSMRSVGTQLGVEAMSLYHHVANKDELLDLLADRVFGQIATAGPDQEWRAALTTRGTSMREVLGAHPWALRLVDARRSPSPHQLRHHDAVLGCLFANGFSARLATHAISALDSYVYGFVLTEQNLPFEPGETTEEFVDAVDLPLAGLPNLARMISELVVGQEFRYADEFEFGLRLILDGIAGNIIRSEEPPPRSV